MLHPCPQEHPLSLLDAPADVLESWWHDCALWAGDSTPLLDAMTEKHRRDDPPCVQAVVA